MTVGRRWRLRCHSVPPADRRCFPSSAVLPQPLLASLALGVSPWAHGRVWIGSPDFDRDRIRTRRRTRTADRDLTWHADCGRRSPVLFSSFGSNFQPKLLIWLLGFWLLAFCHGSSFKRLVLAAICFAWCQWPSAFSRICNPHRSAARRRRRTPRCLFVGLLKFTIDLQDTWSRLIA